MFDHWSSNTIPFNFLHPNDLLFWTLCLTWLLLALAVLGEGTWSSHSPSFSSHFMVSGGAWGKGLECPKSNDTQQKSSYFSDTYILFLLCATWTCSGIVCHISSRTGTTSLLPAWHGLGSDSDLLGLAEFLIGCVFCTNQMQYVISKESSAEECSWCKLFASYRTHF